MPARASLSLSVVLVLAPRRTAPSFALLCMALVALVVTGGVFWPSSDDDADEPPRVTSRQARVDVLDGPEKNQRIQLDLRLYIPERTPAPTVLLAHGFSGDKDTLAGPARRLAARGFSVLTYSARGFGDSTGKIALNSPEHEVTDAHQVLDWLARQPEVATQAEGDPLIGVAGVSYGGALSLLLAGTDSRVDAIAPIATYNDLADAILPNAASPDPIPTATAARGASGQSGVFRNAWARILFNAGHGNTSDPHALVSSDAGTPGGGSRPSSAADRAERQPATCGNLTKTVCRAYTELAQTGEASESTRKLLRAASPKSVTTHIDLPTLLVQPQQDGLFGLDQADANARQIAAAGGTVKMIWTSGDVRTAAELPSRIWRDVGDWFKHYLHETGEPRSPDPGTEFSYRSTAIESSTEQRTMVAETYPGVNAQRVARVSLSLHGDPARVVNPPGGNAVTDGLERGDDGAGDVSTSEQATPTEKPTHSPTTPQSTSASDRRRSVTFRSDDVEQPVRISGIPQAELAVASVPNQPSTGSAVLFADLYDVGPDGSRTPVGNGTSPIRLSELPADGESVTVDVALPATVHTLRAGHRLELRVSTTDPDYATPTEPAVHQVRLAGRKAVSVPTVDAVAVDGPTFPARTIIAICVIFGLISLSAIAAMTIRRFRRSTADLELADVPLSVHEVTKSYRRAPNAIHGLSMRVDPGRIVGLLGPNGAGKTTLLRIVLGMARADAGRVHVFGHPVRPGVPVLSRVGGIVESPGLLPHLSGLDNLRTYWEATGRPLDDAKLDQVLEVAGLGSAVDRRVETYGQGMKQRLALAQAMLGMPDLLVLDEPTTALDPSHIQQMRRILRDYAATGRAVVLSSHLLSEVEQTCTDVVVLHEGEVVARGSVAEIIGVGSETTFAVDRPQEAAEELRSLEGIGEVRVDGDEVHADLAEHGPAVAVNILVAAGVELRRVGPRRRLEDAFLELVGEER